ncbi:WD40-repeat-containing domain protein, partial [Haematococcus lacustris]
EFAAHTGTINCVRIGRKSSGVVVTGGEDRMVNLWTIGAQTRTLSLAGHQTPVEAVCFDLNEEIVAAGAASGSIKLFDLDQAKGEQANRQTVALTGHRSNVRCLDFTLTNLLSGSMDTNVKLWDLRRKDSVMTCKGHRSGVLHVRFSPDGRMAASGSEDGEVKVRQQCRSLPRSMLLFCLRPSAYLALATSSLLWCSATLTCHHTHQITGLDFHPQEYLMATCSADKTVKIWDLDRWQLLESTPPETTAIRATAFHPDGNLLFSALADGLRVWQFENGPITQLDSVDVPWAKVSDMTMMRDRDKLVGCSFHNSFLGMWVVDLKEVGGCCCRLSAVAACLLLLPVCSNVWLLLLPVCCCCLSVGAGAILPASKLIPSSGHGAVTAQTYSSHPTAEVSDIGCWPQPALRSSSRTDLQPGSTGATDVATSGSGPLLPAGSGLGPLAANRPLPSTSYLTQRNGAAPCLEPVKPGNAGQGTAEGLRVPRRGAEAARPSMVSVGVGVGDSLMRRDVQPSQLQKLAQMASEQPGQSPAAGPARGFLAGPVPVQGPSSSRDAPEPPRANRYSQGSSRTDCQLLPSSQVNQPQLPQQQEGYGSAGGPWHARGIQGGGGPAPCARTDMELMDDITQDCDTMQRLLRARASGTQAMRAFLQRGDLRGALGAARRQSEPSIAADVLAALASRPGFGNMLMLEHVPDLVPVLEAILGLPGDPHVQVALDLGLVVCKCFGATIKDVCAAVPARGGVDMAFEQRQAKCETARMVLQGLKAKVAWCLHQRDPGSLVAQKAAQLVEQLMNVC